MLPFQKTFASLFRAKLWWLLLICAALAASIVAAIVVGVTGIAAYLVNIDIAWLKAIFTASVGLLTGIAGWFMLPPLTILVAGFFQETAIRRVEQAYYPFALRGDLKFWPELWHDARFTLWSIFLNMLVLPLYAVGVGFVVSALLNGYLVGREFFETAAGYHLGKPAAKALRQKHRMRVYKNGLALALLTLIPVINLFMPLVAVVWMVHVYHAISDSERTI